MTTVFTSQLAISDPKAIGTHVFIVGVGKYPALLGGDPDKLLEDPMGLKQLSSPPVSAAALATWFLARQGSPPGVRGFHNPTAPLATIEMLLAGSDKYTLPDGKTQQVEVATRHNIALCFSLWKERSAANDANIAVFYFCGHGLMAGNEYLLPSDFGVLTPDNPWADAIDITDTARALRRLTGGTLYFFIDACRQIACDALSPGASPPALAHLDFKKPLLGYAMLTLRAAGEGRKAFGATSKVSRFTQALIEALSGYEAEAAPDGMGWIVTGSRLASSVSKILEAANLELEPEKHQHVEEQLIGSQPFHTEIAPPLQIVTGIPSTWAASTEARQLLVKWGVAGIMSQKELEPLAEELEARQGDTAAGSSRELSVRNYFEIVLPTMLRWKGLAATALNKRVRFSLMDAADESWTMNLEPPVATVTPNDVGHVDLSIRLTSACMEAILTGEFNAKEAIMDGKIKLAGDISLLKTIGTLFGSQDPSQ